MSDDFKGGRPAVPDGFMGQGGDDGAAFLDSHERHDASAASFADKDARFEASGVSRSDRGGAFKGASEALRGNKGSSFMSASSRLGNDGRASSEGASEFFSRSASTDPDGPQGHSGGANSLSQGPAGPVPPNDSVDQVEGTRHDPASAFTAVQTESARGGAFFSKASGGKGASFAKRTANRAVSSAVNSIGEEGTLSGQTSRTVVRGGYQAMKAAKAVRNMGAGKAGAFTAAGAAAVMTAGDENGNASSKVSDGYRIWKRMSTWRKNARAKHGSGQGSQGYAARKSHEIAKAVRETRAVDGMGFWQRVKSAASGAVKSFVYGAMDAVRLIIFSLGSAGSAFVGLCLTILISLLVILGSAGAKNANDNQNASLNANEQIVANFFREKGLDDVHIAAIMGNMYAESGINPGAIESNGIGHGICQWSYGRYANLVTFATQREKLWNDLQTQLDFFWEGDEWHTNWSRAYRIKKWKFEGDPAVGTRVSGSKSAFLATNDVEAAVREFCYGWEGAGLPHLSRRYEAARKYLSALQGGGGGQDYATATEAQRKVVDTCKTTPSPGGGLCAMWVSHVFNRLGYGYYGGNANDMYRNWCTSSDRSELKVGMIIAVDTHPHTPAGRIYGHVGIYIGDGKVMSNIGSIYTQDLDDFIKGYGATHPVKWGWIGGRDLSA